MQRARARTRRRIYKGFECQGRRRRKGGHDRADGAASPQWLHADGKQRKNKSKKSKISKQIAFELTQAAPQRLCY